MNEIMEIINEWDPIELFPMAPTDEYIFEVKKILSFINQYNNCSDKELSEYINFIFLSRFGNDIYTVDGLMCLNVAKKILEKLR